MRLLSILLCAGMSTQFALAQNPKDERRGSSSFDKSVDVGSGRKLHINCSGINIAGAPTVVLEAGAGNPSTVWNRVQPEVAKFTRVCVYDRAGLGGSDPVPTPRTVVALTEDLRTLLVKAEVDGPYVMVGHSLGGILVRLYASYYPADVAGMVLVDSTHEDEADRGLALIPRETFKEMLKKLGPADLVPRSEEQIDGCSTRAVMNTLDWRGNIPLVVLTPGRPFGPDIVAVPSVASKAYQLHLALQRDIVRRSSRGQQILAKKSGHFIHQDQPELVVAAIRQVVNQVKSPPGGRSR
ncbi:MAG TPA: alpha/beta hydrolase [Pyrinomonadaceae bacterium]|nr:alpha/beta hydrolase [Pyrinomonadaceae bacterium]